MAAFDKKTLNIERNRRKALRERQNELAERSIEIQEVRDRVKRSSQEREEQAFQAYRKEVKSKRDQDTYDMKANLEKIAKKAREDLRRASLTRE